RGISALSRYIEMNPSRISMRGCACRTTPRQYLYPARLRRVIPYAPTCGLVSVALTLLAAEGCMLHTPCAFALPLHRSSHRALASLALLSMLLSACASNSQQATRAASSSPLSSTASPHSAATSTPRSTATSMPAPYTFPLLPPGASLPSEATCASRVHRSSFEPRPDNHTANHEAPTVAQLAALTPWDESIGVAPSADTLRNHTTGRF